MMCEYVALERNRLDGGELRTAEIGKPAPRGAGVMRLALDQTDITRARSLGRFLGLELDALSLAKQFEHRSADGASVEEMLYPSLVANEPESFVDEEPCNRPGRHTRILRMARTLRTSQGIEAVAQGNRRRVGGGPLLKDDNKAPTTFRVFRRTPVLETGRPLGSSAQTRQSGRK
jgi:hypothetical protein